MRERIAELLRLSKKANPYRIIQKSWRYEKSGDPDYSDIWCNPETGERLAASDVEEMARIFESGVEFGADSILKEITEGLTVISDEELMSQSLTIKQGITVSELLEVALKGGAKAQLGHIIKQIKGE